MTQGSILSLLVPEHPQMGGPALGWITHIRFHSPAQDQPARDGEHQPRG
jgi:hypothetical protein